MEILFASTKLQKLFSSVAKLRRKFGPRMAERIQQRLAELEAATTLKEMERLPAARCHELHENLRGKFAVDLVHPKRLMFEPAQDPVPRLEAGNIDTARITKITVLEVVDYHGK